MKKKITLEALVKATKGMNPVEFEAYCEENNISIEWLDVTITNFNDGVYNVVLSDFNDANVFAMDGEAVEIEF
jgi:hypothetical protein